MVTDWRVLLFLAVLVLWVLGPVPALFVAFGAGLGFVAGQQHEREMQEYRAFVERLREERGETDG